MRSKLAMLRVLAAVLCCRILWVYGYCERIRTLLRLLKRVSVSTKTLGLTQYTVLPWFCNTAPSPVHSRAELPQLPATAET